MTRSVLTWLLLAVSSGGCAERGRLNLNCEWNEDPHLSLNLQNSAQQRHVNHDALVAEEIAIRYADVRRGHRSGHFEGVNEYSRTRDECLASLMTVIAVAHDVTTTQVRDAMGRRDRRVDVTILMAFAALYALIAGAVARWLFRRLPLEEVWPALLATLVSSLIVSTAGVMLGELGASIVEMIRVGNTHLSYRALRIPWAQQRPDLFIGGVILFWLIASITGTALARGRVLSNEHASQRNGALDSSRRVIR